MTNTAGDIAYDIAEFYINAPPTTGNGALFVSNPLLLGAIEEMSINSTFTGTVPEQAYFLNLSDWTYNGPTIDYKLYMLVNEVYYLVTD